MAVLGCTGRGLPSAPDGWGTNGGGRRRLPARDGPEEARRAATELSGGHGELRQTSTLTPARERARRQHGALVCPIPCPPSGSSARWGRTMLSGSAPPRGGHPLQPHRVKTEVLSDEYIDLEDRQENAGDYQGHNAAQNENEHGLQQPGHDLGGPFHLPVAHSGRFA